MTERRPEPVSPARIAPLATLPVFLRLSGKRVVLAGASEGALWKAELIAAAGADVHVFAREVPDGFHRLAAHPPAGAVHLHARAWREADLAGAAIAIADADTAEEAKRFAAAARAAGAACNVIDRPEFCTFQFGSIVNRSPLVIGISTDGAAPVFGQAVRARIEAVLPAGLKEWAEAARDWRPHVQARALGHAARRRFWEMFTRRAMAKPDVLPAASDRAGLLGALDTMKGEAPKGRVSLVGAGPGEAELLTLKAVRALQSADVILHDDLVAADVLELARREAKRVRVGKRGHGPSCRQEEISALMLALARKGKHVVRLKSGDPGVFGRASEEIAACAAAGIEVTIVPGITAAQGAAASLGISLTERRVARRLQFVTGHAQDGRLPEDVAWSAIADVAATTVIYMPRRTFASFRDRAIEAGLAPDMPAIAVMNATRSDERRLAASIRDLPERLAAWPEDGPVIVLVGQVVARHLAGGAVKLADAA